MTVKLSIIVALVCLFVCWVKTKKVGKQRVSIYGWRCVKETNNKRAKQAIGWSVWISHFTAVHLCQEVNKSNKKSIVTGRIFYLICWEKVAQCFRGYFDWQGVDFRNGFRWANWSEAEQKGAIRKTQQTTSHPAQLKKAAYILFETERICWRQKSITFFRGTSNPRLWPTICAHLAGAFTYLQGLKFHNVFVSNFTMYLSQISKCICLKL